MKDNREVGEYWLNARSDSNAAPATVIGEIYSATAKCINAQSWEGNNSGIRFILVERIHTISPETGLLLYRSRGGRQTWSNHDTFIQRVSMHPCLKFSVFD